MGIKHFVGIDPGKSGAIVRLDDEGDLLAFAMPESSSFLFNLVEQISGDDTLIMIEKVWAMPKDGSKSAFTFGYNVGQIHMALDYHGANYELVTAHTWQKHFNLYGIKGKKPLLDHAKKLLDGKEIKLTLKTCDAALLALYAKAIHGRRQRERRLFSR